MNILNRGRGNGHSSDVTPSKIDTSAYVQGFDLIRSELDDKHRLELIPGSVDDYDLDKFWKPRRFAQVAIREARFMDAVWLRTTVENALSTAALTLIIPRDRDASPTYYMDKLEQDEQAVGPWNTKSSGIEEIAAPGGMRKADLGKIARNLELEVARGLPGKLTPYTAMKYKRPVQSLDD